MRKFPSHFGLGLLEASRYICLLFALFLPMVHAPGEQPPETRDGIEQISLVWPPGGESVEATLRVRVAKLDSWQLLSFAIPRASLPSADALVDMSSDFLLKYIKDVTSGTMQRNGLYIYLDRPHNRWVGMPATLRPPIPGQRELDESILEFKNHPIIHGKLRALETALEKALKAEQVNRALALKEEIKSFEKPGVKTVAAQGEGEAEEMYRFSVGRNGRIEKLEEIRGGVLFRAVWNRNVEAIPYYPSRIEMAAISDQLKHMTVEEHGLTGLLVRFQAGQVVVDKVLPGSPAAEAGIQVGEIVRQVCGKRVEVRTQKDFDALLKGTELIDIETIGADGSSKQHRLRKVLQFISAISKPQTPAPK